jgi:hypothetical protein
VEVAISSAIGQIMFLIFFIGCLLFLVFVERLMKAFLIYDLRLRSCLLKCTHRAIPPRSSRLATDEANSTYFQGLINAAADEQYRNSKADALETYLKSESHLSDRIVDNRS